MGHPNLTDAPGKDLPERWVLDGYEVEHEFPTIGHRTMLLNARTVFTVSKAQTALLLAIEDISERRAHERELEHLLRQKELLLEEMQHRIANSLQIIASILLLKAKSVQSDETRGHLQDAHKRVLSVAAVQRHLQASGRGEPIEVGPYLTKLCAALAQSMIGESRPVSLTAEVSGGTVVSSEAVSIGLIVIESVINSLKHAFPETKTDGRIVVAYDTNEFGWTLSIADNGVGKPLEGAADATSGLGTSIVQALAKDLDASVDFASDRHGTTLSIKHEANSDRAGSRLTRPRRCRLPAMVGEHPTQRHYPATPRGAWSASPIGVTVRKRGPAVATCGRADPSHRTINPSNLPHSPGRAHVRRARMPCRTKWA